MSRPQDKAYAEQELTKLTDAINQNAGLDFSNRANLQAVLNIGKPLEKDQTIVQSIRSEQTRLKNLEDLKKLQMAEPKGHN
jgi:endoglucanase Acf2